jgi:hypothetical protein
MLAYPVISVPGLVRCRKEKRNSLHLVPEFKPL